MSDDDARLQLLQDLIAKAWSVGMRPQWDSGETTRLSQIQGVGVSGWAIRWVNGRDEYAMSVMRERREQPTWSFSVWRGAKPAVTVEHLPVP